MDKDLMFSSATCEWATPPELFKALDAEFGFTCDVCATADNAKCVDCTVTHWMPLPEPPTSARMDGDAE